MFLQLYLSVHGGFPCDYYPWCIGPYFAPSVQGPTTCTGPQPCSLASDIQLPRLETCSNLFTWGPHCTVPTNTDIWWLAIKARLVSEQSVGILLQCFFLRNVVTDILRNERWLTSGWSNCFHKMMFLDHNVKLIQEYYSATLADSY